MEMTSIARSRKPKHFGLGGSTLRRIASSTALGLSVIMVGSLAFTRPAMAQTPVYWSNSKFPTLFLGVSGGPTCSGATCSINDGTLVVVWEKN